MISKDSIFVGGRWVVRSAGSAWIDVVSPSTEEVVARVPEATTADVDAAVSAARDAFENGPWTTMPVAERAEHLRGILDFFEKRIPDAVEYQIDEMGGTRRFCEGTTGMMKPFLERVIGDASRVPTTEVRDGTVGKVVVLREPIGVTAGVIPWNAPLMAAATKLFPALLMGCPMILKPAPESPLSAYLLAEAAEEAGLPPGLVSILPGGREVGQHLVSHPGVDMVTFTGSTDAGRAIAAICGEQIKHVTLELGGKSAAILTEGIDIDRFVPTLVGSSMGNSGQQCILTTRILVHSSQYGDLADSLSGYVAGLKVGDPHDADTVFGPVVSSRQRDRILGYIESGRSQGAKPILGGGRPADLHRGWYVEPTIFTDVDNSMTIAQEEIFGPVVCLISYETEDEAVAIANDSEFGLGGAVFANDPARGVALAARMRTGTCQINEGLPAGGGGPFGGYKLSGLGRERGPEGLMSFVELKSVSLPPGVDPQPGLVPQ